jgi:hypothetical protein
MFSTSSPKVTAAAVAPNAGATSDRSFVGGLCPLRDSPRRLSPQVKAPGAMRHFVGAEHEIAQITAELKATVRTLKKQWKDFLVSQPSQLSAKIMEYTDLLKYQQQDIRGILKEKIASLTAESQSKRKLCHAPINFSVLHSSVEKGLILLRRFSDLTSDDKLKKIQKYGNKMQEMSLPTETAPANPNRPARDMTQYFKADKAENKLPKAIEKIEKLLGNLSQLAEAAAEAGGGRYFRGYSKNYPRNFR